MNDSKNKLNSSTKKKKKKKKKKATEEFLLWFKLNCGILIT